MQYIKFRMLATSLLLLVLINSLSSKVFKNSELDGLNVLGTVFNDRAEARRSGARTGGGSFRRSTPSRSSSPTRSNPAPIQSNPNRSNNNTIIAPVFIPGSGGYNNNSGNYSGSYRDSSDGGEVILIMVLLGLLGTGFIIYKIFKALNISGVSGSELENDKVTISKLQVGLLAEARAIQQELTEISLEADTDSSEGLVMLLQETAIALLRTPENWVYVSASSEVTTRDKAEDLFNRLSISERTKFSAETLVNMNGRIRQNKSYTADPDQDPAAYIVITLLIGTEYDRPLFTQVNSRDDLQQALENMAAVSPEALSVFELLWTPQSESDALTYDEMLTEYSDMVAI